LFAAALALAAAASWGVGDFFGGLKSRSLNPVAVLIVAQPIGLTLLAIWDHQARQSSGHAWPQSSGPRA